MISLYSQDYHFIDTSTGAILEDSICIPYNGEITLKFNASDIGNFEWIPLGDIRLDTTYSDTARISSTGYAKGAIRIKSTGCSTVKVLYIFKEFYPESNWVISGPECITEGDTVVFSVDPILTKNLDANIGFDKYYWNIYTEDKPSCVADIIYTAGDGSSVTFKIGEITEQDTLKVNLGYCNRNDIRKSIQLPLLKKAPMPNVISDTCISYGAQEVVLYNNPVEGVFYKWILPSDYEEIELTQNYARFKVDDAVSAQIMVVATYNVDGNDGCADTPAYIQINRSFNKNASIQNNANEDCVNVGDDVKFDFENGAPKGASYNWSAPEGWDTITGSQNIHNSSITFRPTSNSNLRNIISVSLSPCGDTILRDTIYVKPCKIPVENIIMEINNENECLALGDIIKLYVNNWNNLKPRGDSIVWIGPNNDWTIIPGVTPDTAYIYVANATSEAVISVCQTGLNNCNGDFTQVRYNYAAIVPSLIEKPSECIASNMPDDIIFSVSPSYPGQRYHWTCNNTILDYNGTTDSSSVRVRTNGLPESYIILEVNAFNDSCGASVSIKDSVMIPRNQYSMSYAEFKEGTEEDYGEFTINGRNLSQTTADFEWYFLDNGIPVADVLSEDGDKYAYYADIQSLYDYGDISLSNRYTVVCVVTMKLSGCKYRKTYGAALPSNYVIPQSSNINSPQRHTIHKNLLTSYVAFPNPSNGILNLKSSNGTNFSYYIYSFSGNLVMSQQNAYSSEYSIDISSLTKGVYEIVYVQHNRRHSGTFIKE